MKESIAGRKKMEPKRVGTKLRAPRPWILVYLFKNSQFSRNCQRLWDPKRQTTIKTIVHMIEKFVCFFLWHHAKNGIWIILGGTRKITVCFSTFYGVAAKITVHTVKCTGTYCNLSSATTSYPNVIMNYSNAVFCMNGYVDDVAKVRKWCYRVIRLMLRDFFVGKIRQDHTENGLNSATECLRHAIVRRMESTQFLTTQKAKRTCHACWRLSSSSSSSSSA